MLQVLSTGEKKALYILNVIFEVQCRRRAQVETVFVVDDIADSFDYKNKYAIVQYLKDIAEEPCFSLIILTHNFDFFRTVNSRFVRYSHCLMVQRTASGLELIRATGIKNIFANDWGEVPRLVEIEVAVPVALIRRSGCNRKETAVDKKSRNKGARQGQNEAKQMQMLLPLVGLLATVKGSLHDLVLGAGMRMLALLLEQDRAELCGERYRHDPERHASRAGYAPGELPMGGRRVSIKRPRVRSANGDELPLPTWETFAAQDPLTTRAVEQMVLGVATRRYHRSLEPLPPEVSGRGTSKSAVSRRFVAATKAELEKWLARDLSELSLVALMVDGLGCGEHTVLVALGIDESGCKHVLGIAEGATENAVACTRLMSSLAARGLDTTRSTLVVIDGGRALAKSVRDTFGQRALIQRCQVHKKRNVLEHLPEEMRSSIGPMLSTAYRMSDPKRALSMLQKIARQLEHKHPGAAGSLREGLQETLTVMGLRLDETLQRTLVTTNPIENINGSVRRVTRNVKRWDGGTMVLRWVGAALQDATRGFRRVKGYAGIPKLVAALRAHDEQLDGAAALKKEPLASRKKAA